MDFLPDGTFRIEDPAALKIPTRASGAGTASVLPGPGSRGRIQASSESYPFVDDGGLRVHDDAALQVPDLNRWEPSLAAGPGSTSRFELEPISSIGIAPRSTSWDWMQPGLLTEPWMQTMAQDLHEWQKIGKSWDWMASCCDSCGTGSGSCAGGGSTPSGLETEWVPTPGMDDMVSGPGNSNPWQPDAQIPISPPTPPTPPPPIPRTPPTPPPPPEKAKCGPEVTEWFNQDLFELLRVLRRLEQGTWDPWGYHACAAFNLVAKYYAGYKWLRFSTNDCRPTGKCRNTVTLAGRCVSKKQLGNIAFGFLATASKCANPPFAPDLRESDGKVRHALTRADVARYGDHTGPLAGLPRRDNLAAFGVGNAIYAAAHGASGRPMPLTPGTLRSLLQRIYRDTERSFEINRYRHLSRIRERLHPSALSFSSRDGGMDLSKECKPCSTALPANFPSTHQRMALMILDYTHQRRNTLDPLLPVQHRAMKDQVFGSLDKYLDTWLETDGWWAGLINARRG